MPARLPKISQRLFRATLRRSASRAWAIEQSQLGRVQSLAGCAAPTWTETKRRLESRAFDSPSEERPIFELAGDVAIVRLDGLMMQRANRLEKYFLGATSTEEVGEALDAAAVHPQVRGIFFYVSTPGGECVGTEVLARRVAAAARAKPLVTFASEWMCSAGYYVGSQGTAIVAEPGAMVGSIGVVMTALDFVGALEEAGINAEVIRSSPLKQKGWNQYEALDDAGREALQALVDEYHGQFVAAVAAGRGVSAATVEKEFGRGGVVVAETAVGRGMVDAVGTREDAVARLRSLMDAPSRSRRAGNASTRSRGAVESEQPDGSPSAAALGDRPLSGAKGGTMNKRVKAWLCAAGLIESVDASDAEASAALAAFCQGAGIQVVADGDAMAAALMAHGDGSRPTATLELRTRGEGGDDGTCDGDGCAAGQAAGAVSKPLAIDGSNRDAILREERARVAAIHATGRLFGVDEEAISGAIAGGLSGDEATAQFSQRMATDRPPVRVGNPQPTGARAFCAMAADAIGLRLGFEAPNASEDARRWSTRPRLLLAIAGETMRANGASGFEYLGEEEQAAAALGLEVGGFGRFSMASGTAASPSDFPTLMNAIIRKSLDQPFGEEELTYTRWAKRVADLPDFKPSTFVRTGEFAEFPQLGDKEEFKDTTTDEDVGWISVDRFGQGWSLTPRMVVDDNLGALADVGMEMRAAHDATLNRLCVNLLTMNALAPDGVALFDNSHANVVATGAAPGVAEIGKVQEAMRRQRGISGHRAIGLRVGLILVPPALEVEALQVLSSQVKVLPITDATGNPFRGTIDVATEAMLEDKGAAGFIEWYGFTTSPLAKPIIFAHQTGFSGMATRNYVENATQCRRWQFEGRFGAAIRGVRGVVRNAGTGA